MRLFGKFTASVNDGARTLTEDDPDFWRDLALGTIVDLSDYQAMRDASKLGNTTLHVDYTITSMTHVRPTNGLVEYYFYDIEGGGENLLLGVKIVGEVFDVFVYFPVPGVTPGNRLDFEQQGFDWLFVPPEDSVPESLLPEFFRHQWRYAPGFNLTIEDKLDNPVEAAVFILKAPGEHTGPCRLNPSMSGVGDMVATVAEYATNVDTMNPEILLFEVGVIDNEDGGLIKAYRGVAVNLKNVEALRTQ